MTKLKFYINTSSIKFCWASTSKNYHQIFFAMLVLEFQQSRLHKLFVLSFSGIILRKQFRSDLIHVVNRIFRPSKIKTHKYKLNDGLFHHISNQAEIATEEFCLKSLLRKAHHEDNFAKNLI